MTRVLLDCHSGGTLVHSMHSDRKLVGHIAKATGARALVVDFRLPEHIAGIRHSIGGNLCTGLVIGLRDRGAPLPAAILTVSPWYDMEMTSETMETKAATDVMVSKEQLGRMRDAWLTGTGVSPRDPRVNLFYADLAGLPPMRIYYGGDEVLAGGAIEFTKRAQSAGADVTLHEVPEMQHSFVFLAGRVPEVNEAIADMGLWLRSKLKLA